MIASPTSRIAAPSCASIHSPWLQVLLQPPTILLQCILSRGTAVDAECILITLLSCGSSGSIAIMRSTPRAAIVLVSLFRIPVRNRSSCGSSSYTHIFLLNQHTAAPADVPAYCHSLCFSSTPRSLHSIFRTSQVLRVTPHTKCAVCRLGDC